MEKIQNEEPRDIDVSKTKEGLKHAEEEAGRSVLNTVMYRWNLEGGPSDSVLVSGKEFPVTSVSTAVMACAQSFTKTAWDVYNEAVANAKNK